MFNILSEPFNNQVCDYLIKINFERVVNSYYVYLCRNIAIGIYKIPIFLSVFFYRSYLNIVHFLCSKTRARRNACSDMVNTFFTRNISFSFTHTSAVLCVVGGVSNVYRCSWVVCTNFYNVKITETLVRICCNL